MNERLEEVEALRRKEAEAAEGVIQELRQKLATYEA